MTYQNGHFLFQILLTLPGIPFCDGPSNNGALIPLESGDSRASECLQELRPTELINVRGNIQPSYSNYYHLPNYDYF